MKQATRPGAGKSVQSEAWKRFKAHWLVKKVFKALARVKWFIKHVIILRDASEILVKKRYKKAKKAAKKVARRVSGSIQAGDLSFLTREPTRSSAIDSSTVITSKVALYDPYITSLYNI